MALSDQLHVINEFGWGILSEFKLDGGIVARIYTRPGWVKGYVGTESGESLSDIQPLSECRKDFLHIIREYINEEKGG